MRVLVTRPEPDALKLKGLIEQRGHQASVEPLLRISFEGCDPVDIEGVTTLVATSRHALMALRGSPILAAARGLTVYAVGAATAEEARRLGFGRVVKGPGTAAGLVQTIASTLDPTEEMVLHLRGEQVAVDLQGELDSLGFRVSEAVVYRMRAAPAFSPAIRAQLSEGEIEAVMLMSAKTAAIYARLMLGDRLQLPARLITHLCLSAAVAERLKPLGNVPVEVAAAPTMEEMLALIDLAAAKLEL